MTRLDRIKRRRNLLKRAESSRAIAMYRTSDVAAKLIALAKFLESEAALIEGSAERHSDQPGLHMERAIQWQMSPTM